MKIEKTEKWKKNDTAIFIKLPSELKDELVKFRRKTGHTMSDFIRIMCKRGLQDYKKGKLTL